jgi:hypothetical protein
MGRVFRYLSAYEAWFSEHPGAATVVTTVLGSVGSPFVAKETDGKKSVYLLVVREVWDQFTKLLKLRVNRETCIANINELGIALPTDHSNVSKTIAWAASVTQRLNSASVSCTAIYRLVHPRLISRWLSNSSPVFSMKNSNRWHRILNLVPNWWHRWSHSLLLSKRLLLTAVAAVADDEDDDDDGDEKKVANSDDDDDEEEVIAPPPPKPLKAAAAPGTAGRLLHHPNHRTRPVARHLITSKAIYRYWCFFCAKAIYRYWCFFCVLAY